LKIENCFVGNHGTGVYLTDCYGASITNNLIFSNYSWGIFTSSQFNAGSISNNKVLANGKNYDGLCGNIYFNGQTGLEHLGSVLGGNDTSYAGNSATLFRRSDASLTSIVVLGGTATATTAAAHTLTTGNTVSVFGASAAPALNMNYPSTITVLSATTFSFATSAAAGTYTESTLGIGPCAYGLYLDNAHGTQVGMYSEDCVGVAAYVGPLFGGSLFVSEALGAAASGVVVLDAATNLAVSGGEFRGQFASLVNGMSTTQHGVDTSSALVFNSGATRTVPSVDMIDGVYYSNAMPASGTWASGRVVQARVPAVGNPKGWVRLTAGSGNVLGTDWASLGDL
jgi:parallel beta-helix repeat protein